MQNVMPSNPYLGPWPYQREHKELFAGREVEAEKLVSRIVDKQFVFLYSPSGAGKSSLINALLQEKLEEQGFVVLQAKNLAGETDSAFSTAAGLNPFIRNMFPSLNEASHRRDLVKDLENLLMAQNLEEMKKEIERNFAAESVRFKREELQRRLEERYQKISASPFVLIFDQFEEIFTAPQQYWEHRHSFFRQIGELAEAIPHTRFLFSFREEYLAFFDRYLDRLGTAPFRFSLGLLTREQALQAIRKPTELATDEARYARLYDKKYGDGVPEAIVSELMKIQIHWENDSAAWVEGEHVEPVQLQLVCRKLWDRLGPNEKVITKAHLEQIGGLERVLVDYYEESIESLGKTKGFPGEFKVRQWVEQHLITKLNTRGTVLRLPNQTDEMPIEIIQTLENGHLLRTEERAGAYWVSLSHDRLIGAIHQSNARYRAKRSEKNKTIMGIALGFLLPVMLLAAWIIFSPRRSSEQALRHLIDAKTYFDNRNYEQAAKDSRKSVDQAPTAEASLLLGRALEKLNHTNEAIRQYEATIQLDRQNAEAYRYLGLLRLNTAETMADSAAAFDALLKYFELSERSPREVLPLSTYTEMVRYHFSRQITSPRRKQAFDLAIKLRQDQVPYHPAGRSPKEGFDALGFVLYVLQQSGITVPASLNTSALASHFEESGELEPMDLTIVRGQIDMPMFFIGKFLGEKLYIGVGPTAFVEIIDRKQLQLRGGLMTQHRIPY